jgi:hypothetical protein
MKVEYTAEDLKKAIRNPFYEKLNMNVTIAIRRDDYKIFDDVAKTNGETPESVMRRCLKIAAKELQEHE